MVVRLPGVVVVALSLLLTLAGSPFPSPQPDPLSRGLDKSVTAACVADRIAAPGDRSGTASRTAAPGDRSGMASRTAATAAQVKHGRPTLTSLHMILAGCSFLSERAELLWPGALRVSEVLADAGDGRHHARSAQQQLARMLTSVLDLVWAAASDDRFAMRDNDIPAGMSIADLVTVGELTGCYPDQPCFMPSAASGTDIAGPATDVPGYAGDGLCGPAGGMFDGESLAEELVYNIAAMVKSMDPKLVGLELQKLLFAREAREVRRPAAAAVGGRVVTPVKPGSAVLVNGNGPS